MMLPTLAECFSSSYPEAMISSLPILTSDLDFARSICGNSALYFDPLDPVDIVSKIIQLYNDSSLRSNLILLGKRRLDHFDSASQRADKILNICQSMARSY